MLHNIKVGLIYYFYLQNCVNMLLRFYETVIEIRSSADAMGLSLIFRYTKIWTHFQTDPIEN
jgi:hypothetical protein